MIRSTKVPQTFSYTLIDTSSKFATLVAEQQQQKHFSSQNDILQATFVYIRDRFFIQTKEI